MFSTISRLINDFTPIAFQATFVTMADFLGFWLENAVFFASWASEKVYFVITLCHLYVCRPKMEALFYNLQITYKSSKFAIE